MTLTASLTLCQYCEHANAADAKFCTGCGAPLHLIPCPQCGAVNQKTSKTCYQCHGQLRESTEILLASAPATASEEAAGNAESTAMSSPYIVQPPTPQRQPIYVVTIIFLAFAAAAYFAYQQRGVVATKEPAVNAAGAINKPAVAPAPAAASAPTQAPVAAEKSIAAPQAASTVAPLQAKVDVPRDTVGQADLQAAGVRKSGGRRRAQAEAAANLPEAPAAVSVAPSSVSGSEKTAPRTRPCTEAIAALGLCTSGPTKGN
jgi:Double zinc ribbon